MSVEQTAKRIALKATKAEHRERINLARRMICFGATTGQVKQAFMRTYGIGHRQVGRYIRLARDAMLQELRRDRESLASESLALYMAIIYSDTSTIAEKLRARKQADELLGLQAPKKIAATGPDGEQTYTAAAMAELMRLAEETQRSQIVDGTFIDAELERDLARRQQDESLDSVETEPEYD